ncbi:MAG: glycosyltransferase [Bacteroidota bacterium]|nr:glycosyltransferase [Bacteroidota bacterium]
MKKTITSVLNQTYPSFELIIVDDGSTDDTSVVVQSFSDQRIQYIKKSNEERGAARNAGIKAAAGDYVTFLDSDDLFYPNHLETAFLELSKVNHELFHIRYEILDTGGKTIKQMEFLDDSANKKLIEGNFMSCQGVFVRRDIAGKNLFNTQRELSGLEDWELWLRLAVKYKIKFHNSITSAIINHEQRSVLNADKEMLIEKTTLFMKLVLSNSEIVNYYSSQLSKFKSSCYSYIALHIALTKKDRSAAVRFLIKSFSDSPTVIFKRRFYATLKHLF